jgi:hypothetical protein
VGAQIQLYSFFKLGARWGGWLTPRPGRFYPPVPILQDDGWVSGPVSTGEEIPPTGFDPRTVQPLASRYTDYYKFIKLLIRAWSQNLINCFRYGRNKRSINGLR